MANTNNTGMHGGRRGSGIRRSGRSRWIDASPAFNHTLQQPTTRGTEQANEQGKRSPTNTSTAQKTQQQYPPRHNELKKASRQAGNNHRKGERANSGKWGKGGEVKTADKEGTREKGVAGRRKDTGPRARGRQHAPARGQY